LTNNSGPQFQPMSFSGLMDATFRHFSNDFGSLVMLSILCNIPGLVFQTSMVYVQSTDTALIIGVALVSMLISMVCGSLLVGALTNFVSATYLQKDISPTEALKMTFGSLGRLIGTQLLVSLIIGIGFVLLFIPGLIWMFTYCLAIPVVVLEGLGGNNALERSKELVKHNRSKVVGTVIGIAILMGIISFGAGLGVGFALTAAGLSSEGLVGIFCQNMIGYIFQPLYSIALVLLYYDLRITHEGFDLEMLSEQLKGA